MKRASLSVLLSLVAPLALLQGCGGETSTVEVGVTSSAQALSAQAPTESPTEVPEGEAPGTAEGEASRLWITIARVDVHAVDAGDAPEDRGAGAAGKPEAPGPDAAGGEASSGWVTVFEGEQRLDLLEEGAAEAFLGSAEVPAGKLTQVRLLLSGDPTLEAAGESLAVSCPSCAETGLKIVTAGQVEAPEGGVLRLTLDFDASTSLVKEGEAYVLKPVVRVARADARAD